MPGPLSMRPHRTKGSWIPRLAGVGVVVVLTGGGLAAYLGSAHQAAPAHHRHAALSARVLKAQTVGLIGFGPDDDRDQFANDPDDHPLKLQPVSGGLAFVTISSAELAAGVPMWTANQMADGSDIFIYVPTGKCLNAAHDTGAVTLAHCTLKLSQRWRPLHARTELGQAFAAYANEMTGDCLTAPAPNPGRGPANPGPATLTRCGPARDKTQEIAFWWSA